MAKKHKAEDLPGSLIYTIGDADLGSFVGELSEIAVDSVLKEGILKDLPIVGALVGIWKTGASVRDALFFRKLLAFLYEPARLPTETRVQLLKKLQAPDMAEDVGEKLVMLIDRFDATTKARLLGKAFTMLAEERITRDEFWRVSFLLERLPLSDLVALKEWRSLDLNRVEHVRRHLYLSVGLGWFVLDASSTGFVWQARLCEIFSDHLLID